jgi:glycosyltransferase involved in cell wall biosynthesis
MKILVYSESFFPSLGGIERVTFLLACGLAEWASPGPDRKMFEVTVVTRTLGSNEQDNKLPFRIVRRPTLRHLMRLISQTDIFHLAGPAILPLVLGLASRKPIVVEHHGFQVACPNGQLFYAPERKLCEGHYMAGHYAECFECNSRETGMIKSAKMLLLTPFRRWLSNRVGANITPTKWLASMLKLSRMTTVYHGITSACDNVTQEVTRPTFAFHGRLVSTKGAEVLLGAAKQLQVQGLDFLIKFIGDGPERRRLEAQAEPLDGHVQFLGPVSDEQLAQLFRDVFAVVVPSLAGEVFGLVVAENMLRGKVLIVSDIGPLEEIVDKTGIVTPAGSVEALASSMYRLSHDPCLASRLGSEAKARAIRLFGVPDMIQSHVSVYLDVVR